MLNTPTRGEEYFLAEVPEELAPGRSTAGNPGPPEPERPEGPVLTGTPFERTDMTHRTVGGGAPPDGGRRSRPLTLAAVRHYSTFYAEWGVAEGVEYEDRYEAVEFEV
jgi:hypothetical protein